MCQKFRFIGKTWWIYELKEKEIFNWQSVKINHILHSNFWILLITLIFNFFRCKSRLLRDWLLDFFDFFNNKLDFTGKIDIISSCFFLFVEKQGYKYLWHNLRKYFQKCKSYPRHISKIHQYTFFFFLTHIHQIFRDHC